MRFLCPKCKAKYQIADEKLEGRAVRMKCRKCGHIIEVPSPSKVTPAGSKSAIIIPESAKVPAKPLPPSAKPSALKPPPPSSKRPTADPLPPAPRSPTGVRPTAPKPAPPKPATQPAPPKPAPPKPPKPAAPLSTSAEASSAVVDQPPHGGLADAFSQKLREPQQSDVSAAIEVLSAGAGEEWYVGINGVPLGPVRLSTLRQKAQQGVIDEESLVWRAGFEEWLPLRTFPELALLVRESRESHRASFVPSSPQAYGLSQPPRTAPTPEPVAVADEFELEPATVIASSAEEVAALAHVTADPFAPKQPTPPSEDVQERRSFVDDIAFGARRQARMHPAAYVLIAIAFGFGVTGAIVFFTSDRTPAPPPTIQVVTVAAPGIIATESPAASVALNPESMPETEVRSGGGARPVTDTKATTDQDPKADPKSNLPTRVGLGAGPAIDGPTVGPSKGSESNLPQQLDQTDIERVVAAHRVSVRRSCWDRALAGRDPKAPKSVKVTVSISIGPSGNVTSASSTGGDGFPGLASCVVGRVRGWKFPASAGTSRANIPFAFFAQ